MDPYGGIILEGKKWIRVDVLSTSFFFFSFAKKKLPESHIHFQYVERINTTVIVASTTSWTPALKEISYHLHWGKKHPILTLPFIYMLLLENQRMVRDIRRAVRGIESHKQLLYYFWQVVHTFSSVYLFLASENLTS